MCLTYICLKRSILTRLLYASALGITKIFVSPEELSGMGFVCLFILGLVVVLFVWVFLVWFFGCCGFLLFVSGFLWNLIPGFFLPPQNKSSTYLGIFLERLAKPLLVVEDFQHGMCELHCPASLDPRDFTVMKTSQMNFHEFWKNKPLCSSKPGGNHHNCIEF